MFGIGAQELLIIGLLFLLIFGPGKAAGMARELGRFVSGVQNTVEEFNEDLLSEEVREINHTVGELKNELNAPVQEFKVRTQHSAEEPEPAVAVPAEEVDDSTAAFSPDEGREHGPKDEREPPRKVQVPPHPKVRPR